MSEPEKQSSGLRNWIAVGVHNPVLANILMVAMLAAGLLCSYGLVRERWPDISLNRIEVYVEYPGAGAEEVEQSICTRIEEAIQGVSGIEWVQSIAMDNAGKVQVRLMDSVDDSTPSMLEIKDRVEQIDTFPDGIEKPVVKELIYRMPVIKIALSGNMPERTLNALAREIARDLREDDQISLVTIDGVRDYEIKIEISQEALQRYNLSFDEVAAAVSRNTLEIPAGTLRMQNEEITLRTVGKRYTAREFQDLVLIARPDGTLLRLGDVASVTDGFADEIHKAWFNGQPGAGITVYKTPEQDASILSAIVKTYVNNKRQHLPTGIEIETWADASKDIEDGIDMLIRNGFQGICLVVLVLTLFLSPRVSLFTALGIPISFAGAIILMRATGESLNMMSLLALIMATGIVVDDAIVIAERCQYRLGKGDSPMDAAINGTAEIFPPVVGSVITTMIAFIPLMYVKGILGPIVSILPVVMIACLATSLFEAVAILPAHMAHVKTLGTHGHSWYARMRRWTDQKLATFVVRYYRPGLEKALHARGITICAATGLLLLCIGVVWGGRMPISLLPEMDGNMIRAQVRFPEGTASSVTEQALDRLVAAAWQLNEDPEFHPGGNGKLVQQVFSKVGSHTDRMIPPGSRLGEVNLELMPAEVRKIDCGLLIARWRELVGEMPEAEALTFNRIVEGPQEIPLEIRLSGDDMDRLYEAGKSIRKQFETFEGVFDIEIEPTLGKRELQVSLKPTAQTLGITVETIARQLRSGFYGGEAVTIQRKRDEVTVRVRYPHSERTSIGDIERMRIKSPTGVEVPFLEVAEVHMNRGWSMIVHENGKRRVRVLANLDPRITNAERVLTELKKNTLPDLAELYNVEYSLEGQHAQISDSMTSLMRGFILAMIAIYALLAGMLHSYFQPLIIMAAIPFGFIGALAGHWIMGFEFTVFSMFGVVALAGVVVNDSLVLIDQINRYTREGKPVVRSIIRSGEVRFRAVMLTSITTVAGLLPLLTERSSQAQTVLPIAVSLAFGLIAATVLTLLLVPVLYLLVNDAKRLIRWLHVGGDYPSAEEIDH